VFTSPVFVWGDAKVLFASLTTGAVVMLAVSAWQLRHRGDLAVFTRSARMALISAIPRGSQLAAASRSRQPHLPRLRAAGDALEFGAGDLVLDAAGARQIFAIKQVSLTPEQAAAVTERTEGWPVGLYLAAAIAKASHGQASAVTGEDRYVADYLYSEALAPAPEDRQRFLRRTAVLDQLCGPLCDAVLGSSGAGEELRRMEATSLRSRFRVSLILQMR